MSGCFLRAWDYVRERCGSGGSWAHAQREVWVDKHLAICHPGDLRHVFFERAEKVGYWRKKNRLLSSALGTGLAMERVTTARIKGPEKCSGCTREARVNEQDVRAGMPFKTRFQVLGRCLREPGWTVPVMKSQELVRVLVLSGEPSAG